MEHTMKNIKRKKSRLLLLSIIIITLLILVVLIIGMSKKEGGLIAKVSEVRKASVQTEMKEKLDEAIQKLKEEKEGMATLLDITQDWADKELEEFDVKIIEDPLIKGKRITMAKNEIVGRFTIDEQLVTTEEKEQGNIQFLYDVIERIENKVQLLIHVQDSENGIKQIEMPEGYTILASGKKDEIYLDYEAEIGELGKDKKLTITSKNEEKKEESLYIEKYYYNITKIVSEKITIDDNNILTKVEYNKPYNATITVEDGYTIGTLKVTMGEEVIIEDTSARTINIDKVTNDIKIIAVLKPIINFNKDESLVLDVTVDYPEIKNINIKKEYSVNGSNYYEYIDKAQVKDDCIFYARVVNTQTNEILVQTQEAIDNIIYEWEVWNIAKQQVVCHATQKDYTSSRASDSYEVYRGCIMSSTGWVGTRYVGTYSVIFDSFDFRGYYVKWSNTEMIDVRQVLNKCFVGTRYYVYYQYNDIKGTTKYNDVTNTNKGSYPANGVQGSYWYVLKSK